MRTTDCDSNLSSDSSQLDLESPETDRRREEQSAYDDRRVDQLSSLRGGSVAGVDERSTSTRTRWTCGHPRLSGSWEGDTAARRKVVGVATPFIVGRPKSSDTDVSPSTDRDSRRQESSASSSLSSSSSSSFSAVTGGMHIFLQLLCSDPHFQCPISNVIVVQSKERAVIVDVSWM